MREVNTIVKMIEIDKIFIPNPRTRNRKTFNLIRENITLVGLKRPIKVKPSVAGLPSKDYDLICGQGRLEAFMECGERLIPAIIVEVSEEKALIMGLVENVARIRHRAVEMLEMIRVLSSQGYDTMQIASKTGLSTSYITSILRLLESGEGRLIEAVEAGYIPLTTATIIAATKGEELQKMLLELYKSKELTGKRLLFVKRMMETRRTRGKASRGAQARRGLNSKEVMQIYRKEVDRKRLLTRRAENANARLLFVTAALKRLMNEGHFTTLLRAENLTTLPKPLSDLIDGGGVNG